MLHFGLIGKTLTHSFSKTYFTEKFLKLNIKADYALCELNSIDQFHIIFNQAKWNGFNVTIPYKESIIPYLSSVTPFAKEIGAINVIEINNNNLIGHNTDIIGFTSTLKPLIRQHHVKALILGNGGASKAVQAGLRQLEIPYDIVTRQPNNNCFLYSELTKEIIEQHPIIINTTSLGMYPNIGEFPDIPYHYLTAKHLCYDLIYNPQETLFMAKSKQYDATTINGLSMLYAQADAAFNIWFNHK